MPRFRLEDLSPAMRAQAEAKMRELKRVGTVRTNKCQDDPDKEGYREKKAKLASPAESKLERRFSQQLAEAGIRFQRNWFPILGRDWELDYCLDPERKLAVEVDGMAHRTKGRFKADMEKHAELILAGWKVLRVCGDDVRHGRAIEWAKRLLDL